MIDVLPRPAGAKAPMLHSRRHLPLISVFGRVIFNEDSRVNRAAMKDRDSAAMAHQAGR